MADGSDPLCFTCGLPYGGATRLNHLPSGQVCTSCRDRLLEAIPAPFARGPSQITDTPEAAPEAAQELEPELVRLPHPERFPSASDYDPEPA